MTRRSAGKPLTTILVVVAAAVASPATATGVATRSVRFHVAEHLPGSDRVVVRGTVALEVPRTWTRYRKPGYDPGVLRYRFARASGCASDMAVSARLVATR